MDLTNIVSISGKSGLFKIITQGKNAVIVESLTDQKRFPAFGHEKMSSLEEISVFTTGEDRPLKDVFKSIYEKLEGKATVDPKSENPALLKFFAEMVPDFDQDRVERIEEKNIEAHVGQCLRGRDKSGQVHAAGNQHIELE